MHLKAGQAQIHNIIMHNSKITFLEYRLRLWNSEYIISSLLDDQRKEHFS